VAASPRIKLAPSILSADFSRLGEQVAEAEAAGADYIHIDVMDGRFVPQITIGASVVAAIRRCTGLPLDVHLMIEEPQRQLEQFARAGADIITVHIEACSDIKGMVRDIKKLGVKVGVSINPDTSVDALDGVLPELDLALVMSVNPGFAGQTFIPHVLDKIARLRAELDDERLSAELEVDGGIDAGNAATVAAAGGRVLVAGSAVFVSGRTVRESLEELRANAEAG